MKGTDSVFDVFREVKETVEGFEKRLAALEVAIGNQEGIWKRLNALESAKEACDEADATFIDETEERLAALEHPPGDLYGMNERLVALEDYGIEAADLDIKQRLAKLEEFAKKDSDDWNRMDSRVSVVEGPEEPDSPELPWKPMMDKRLAALEGLHATAMEHGHDTNAHWRERAEKAEAEVEKWKDRYYKVAKQFSEETDEHKAKDL